MDARERMVRMAETPAVVESGEETSQWGLPLDWDGHALKPYPFFCESVSAIDEEGWKYIKESTNVSWVIIPRRSENGYHDER
jgi:hypothetical protein